MCYSLVSLVTAKVAETAAGVENGTAKRQTTLKLMELRHGLLAVLVMTKRSGERVALKSASFFPKNFGYSVCVHIKRRYSSCICIQIYNVKVTVVA